MLEDLTFQQFCALDYHRNMVVTSGPGAGKTRILSHRFCFLLLSDDAVSLPQILTLTFTEKAAEEMKGRIYGMLTRLERDLDNGRREKESLRRRIREAREQFHKNRISTIHSFCATLLRDHPVESGIDPGFTIIQGARQRGMMEEAIENAMVSVLEDDPDGLFLLLQSFGNRTRLLRAIRHIIEHPLTFKTAWDSSERLFRTKGWQRQVFEDYCRLIRDEYLIPYVRGLKKLGEVGGQWEDVLAILETWYDNSADSPADYGVPKLFRKLRKLALDRGPRGPRLSVHVGLKAISYLDLLEQFYPDLFSDSPPDGLFESQLRVFLNVAKRCLEQYGREKEKINVLDFADLESLCHRFLTKLYESDDTGGLMRIQGKFRYVMVDEFQDTNRVQWEIIGLLCSTRHQNEKRHLSPGKLFVVGDKRQAIYKFRGGDVTVFQYGTDKIKASNPDRPVQMFWQDPILRSRVEEINEEYAELLKRHDKIFDALPEVEREKILMGDIYLPENFRTERRPVSFLNTTFAKIFSNNGAKRLHEYETAPMPIRLPGGDQGAAKSAGSVTIYLAQGSASRKDQAEREASLILDIIENLLGRNGKERFEYGCYPDIRERIEKNQLAIGILLFAFTHLKTYEEVLREADLSFKVHRGKGFYRCQEVMEMIQLLRYLSDERQGLSLLAALRSPIFALKDSEIFDLFYGRGPNLEQFLLSDNQYVRSVGEQIQAWRLLSTRMTTAELIRRIIADRSLTATYAVHPNGMQRLANVEKLVGIARHFQAEGNGLHQFVEYCLEMLEEEEEEGEALIVSEAESPIWLMTIHAAKGLEFPMVIIPDLHRAPPTRTPLGRPIRLYASGRENPGKWNSQEGEIPIWPIEIPQLDYKKVYGPLGYLLTRRNKLEEMAENRRVFYVGCTRTRNHLILMGHTQKRMMKKDKTPLTSEDYREKATILDLLDDIYQFNRDFTETRPPNLENNGGRPAVIRKEPRPRTFRGITYAGEKIKREDFGSLDDKMKKRDLTEPVRSSPFYQFSFKSMRIFKKCPILFYYNAVLGLDWNELRVDSKGDGPRSPGGSLDETGEHDYVSEEALFVGNAIHGYLEGHRFGTPLDITLFNAVWGRLNRPDLFAGGLKREAMRGLRGKVLNQLETTVHDRRLLKMLGGEVEHAEVPFSFSIAGCEFRGSIDRLFKEGGHGPWIIIDWKSNDLSDRDPRLVSEENYYHLQLACYKWAVEHISREEVGDVYIYFTDGGELIKGHWEGHPRDIMEEMLQKVEDYEADRSFWIQDLRRLKMSPENCLYCQFQDNLCSQEGLSF